MARFDRTETLVTDIHRPSPVYHRVPDWHRGEGHKGEAKLCNRFVYPGTRNVIGDNEGRYLPENVVAPCGLIVLHRKPPIERLRGSSYDVLDDSRMVPWGTVLPLGHADRIGRPCKKCWTEHRSTS